MRRGPRVDRALRARYRAILNCVGGILALAGLLLLVPLLVAEPAEWSAFLTPAGLALGVGLSLARRFRPSQEVVLRTQDGAVVVVGSWLLVILISTWPLITVQGLNFTQAVFESVSAWTTCGLSVVDVLSAPRSILLWRSLMQLAGGAGWAIIVLAAIAGPPGTGLASAEGRSDQLVPHVRQSARIVAVMYGGYALLGTIALAWAGMTWFEAVNHSFAAVSTGGFSTRPESYGYWDSGRLEAVTTGLMLLGTTNFLTAWLFFRGQLRAVLRNGEVRLLAWLLPLSCLLLFDIAGRPLYATALKAARVACFEASSALSTTGFATVGYGDWPAAAILVMVVLMVIGGGTVSTAGGMKLFRIHLLGRVVLWELRRLLLPSSAVQARLVQQGSQPVVVRDEQVRQLAAFSFLYAATLTLGVGVLAIHGYSLRDSLFEFASALGTVGLSIGVTTADAPPWVLWAESVGMLLGRLEFLVVFVGLARIATDLPALVGRPRWPARWHGLLRFGGPSGSDA